MYGKKKDLLYSYSEILCCENSQKFLKYFCTLHNKMKLLSHSHHKQYILRRVIVSFQRSSSYFTIIHTGITLVLLINSFISNLSIRKVYFHSLGHSYSHWYSGLGTAFLECSVLFRSFKVCNILFPSFFWVFGDLWNPKESSILFRSFLKNGKECKKRNVLLQRT